MVCVLECDIDVTELHAYDFVINGGVICARPCIYKLLTIKLLSYSVNPTEVICTVSSIEKPAHLDSVQLMPLVVNLREEPEEQHGETRSAEEK